MPYYKDINNGVHFLDDASFSNLLPAGCVEITQDEADTLNAPPAQEVIKSNIAILQAKITDRMRDEMGIGSTSVFPANTEFSGLTSAQAIAQIYQQIAALRVQLGATT